MAHSFLKLLGGPASEAGVLKSVRRLLQGDLGVWLDRVLWGLLQVPNIPLTHNPSNTAPPPRVKCFRWKAFRGFSEL